MRPNSSLWSTLLLGGVLSAFAAPTVGAPRTAQSVHCSEEATKAGLTGAKRVAFRKTCMTGSLAPKSPTQPTPNNKEAKAVTAPSGADRTTRSKQCSDEADRRGLSAKDRNAFRLSCLATAGPVTEGQTGTQAPKPAKAIPGIGINRYKPSQ